LVLSTEPENRDFDLDELEQRFKDFLYAQKGKVTNERLALLRTLYINDGHFSVDDLLEMMAQDKVPISRATVYRTLDLLVQSGLVKKLALEDQETRYGDTLSTGHHDHIVCIDCHKIIEFFNEDLEKLQDEILGSYHLKPVKHIHQLYGACTRKDCPDRPRKGA